MSPKARRNIVELLGGEEKADRADIKETLTQEGTFNPELFKGEYCFISSGDFDVEGTVTQTDTKRAAMIDDGGNIYLTGDNFCVRIDILKTKGEYFRSEEKNFRDARGHFYGFKKDGLEIKMFDGNYNF